MNKKIVVFLIFIFVIIGAGLGWKIKVEREKAAIAIEKEKERERREEQISLLRARYAPFIEGRYIADVGNDSLANFFNDSLSIHDKIDSLKDFKITIEDVKSLDVSLDKIVQEKENIANLEYDSIDNYLQNYEDFEQMEIKRIYDESNLSKEISSDYERKDEYLSKLDSVHSQLTFLKENKNRYTLETDKITYKEDTFFQEYENMKIDLPIRKAVDLGKRIPILMYHGVKDVPWGNSSLFVTVSDFENQMKYLHDNGFTTLFLSEITSAKNYEKPVILTFDDGYMDMYTTAYPIMKQYGLKSNMYIITRWLDGSTYMTADMVKELSDSGLVEIGSHTLSHVYLASKSYEEQENQLKESKNDLEMLLGKEINTIAYPYGSRNANTLKIARNYYTYALTTEDDYNYDRTIWNNNLILKRKNIPRGLSLSGYKNILE